ncbi:MAG TPA: Flp family type IVb pilin [Rhizomicrobium sp.]|nr:Flp family type IVb pilin [Rhizomicrobium sp.]
MLHVDTDKLVPANDSLPTPLPRPTPAQSVVTRFISDTSGATAIEYAMIAGIVSIVIFTAVQNIGTTLLSYFNAFAGHL